MEYLKSKQYYIDLYDRNTVERCRSLENKKTFSSNVPRGKKVSKEEVEAISNWAHDFILTIEKGERWLNKNKTINDWMDRDRERDEFIESTSPPEGIRCLTCRNSLQVDSKQLWESNDDKPDRILFIFECPNKCLPRRVFFNDGEEWRSKPHLCIKCGGQTKHKTTDDNIKMITTYTCLNCSHVEIDEYEWLHKKDNYDENFAADRDRFCLSEEEGREFQEMKWGMERMAKFSEEWEEKQKALAKKLEENPKGFHLEGAGYRCSICGDSTPEGDNWYDKWGIKCLICQWSIDHKEIPASISKNEDSWYCKYDFEKYFNVKYPTLNKWVKEGMLKPRIVSRYGAGVHTQVFLIKDNKKFLPPKKLLESKRGKLVGQGKKESQMYPWYCFGNPHEILKGYEIMNYLRVLSPEEVKQREEEKKKKEEARRIHREKVKLARESRKKRK